MAVSSGALLVALTLPASGALAAPGGGGCDNRNNNTYDKLLGCVTLEGVREHQQAFQEIADKNHDPLYPGTRAAGTEGYEDSVDYVAACCGTPGTEVDARPVPVRLRVPGGAAAAHPGRGRVRDRAPSPAAARATVDGNVIPVDINLTGDRASDQRLRGRGLRRPRLDRPTTTSR